MRRESYSVAAQYSLGRKFMASNPVNQNSVSKTLRDLDRKFRNEKAPQQQAFSKSDTRAGVNER